MPIGFVGPALQGASMISRFGIPLLQQAGITAGIAGLGAAANALSNIPPSLSQGTRRGKAGRNQYSGVIGSIPPSADGKSYRRAELELADAARAGGGGGGGGNAGYSVSSFAGDSGTPADRAYKQEASRVAQLTEQDPLFKKYKIGELTKAYNEAKGDERERIGLQIWATTNPKLAERLRPGQVGYQTSAALKGSQVFGTDVPGITETMYQQASQAAGLPSNISFTASDPRFSNAFGTGLNAEQLGVSAPGTMPPSMIGADLFKRDFDIPSSKDLKQTELALLKRAIESRIK